MPTKTIQKHGTVQALNVSPKGSYEGLLLEEENGHVIQVNFGHEGSAALSESARAGTSIALEVEPEPPAHGKSSHPVFRLVAIGNGNGNSFSGTVTRLNYALHGEVNGGILDTGEFLHLKPHGAAALGIKIGMQVTGTGTRKPMIAGGHHVVIEAIEVNGITIEKKPQPKPKKKAAHR